MQITKQKKSLPVLDSSITKTLAALKLNGFEPILLETKAEALSKIKSLIPKGASVIQGSSKTLEEIGFIEYLKSGEHGWNNLQQKILAEKDSVKQSLLRKQSTIADFYLGSVHALTETGELLIVSNTGSQMPSIVFNATNLIFVIGLQKIVSNLSNAFERLENVVIPLEDARIHAAYGIHTMHAKTLILHKENPMFGRNVRVLIVKESLGF